MVDWIVRDKVRSSRRGEGRFHDLGIEIFCFYQWEKEERIDQLRQTIGGPRSDICWPSQGDPVVAERSGCSL
jgi:hypothetical protein